MVGWGPPLAAVRLVVWAEADWLKGMIRAAMVMTSPGITRRSPARRAVRAMFTAILLFRGHAERPFRSHGKAFKKALFRLCGRRLGAGYPNPYSPCVNYHRKYIHLNISH